MTGESTDIIILLDRSGSMQQRRDDHEGGLRSFVKDSRNLPGDPRLSFILFDRIVSSPDPCEFVLDRVPMVDVDEAKLKLTPRGDTPLLDAVGTVLTRYEELGSGTILMIITDGQENSSKVWKKDAIQALIKKREERGWKVLYLGANVDEFHEARSLGVNPSTALGTDNTPQGLRNSYESLCANVSSAYSARSAGTSVAQAMENLDFTQEQRTSSRPPTQTSQTAGSPESKDKEKTTP